MFCFLNYVQFNFVKMFMFLRSVRTEFGTMFLIPHTLLQLEGEVIIGCYGSNYK